MIRAFVQTRQSMLLALMALVLAMRVLMPAGFMPTMADHGITVTLCTGADVVDVAINLDGKAPAKPHQGADAPCIFAAGLGSAAMLAWPPMATLVALPLIDQLPVATIADLTPHRLAAPPPPAIGPPAAIQA